jgi:ribosome-associated translation inhibitor RaiA
MAPSPAVESRIRERATKLERLNGRITTCRVVVHAPHRRHTKGELYTVRVDLTVPGHQIVAQRDRGKDHAHEDIYVAIRDAFDAASRQLGDMTRSRGRETPRARWSSVGL